MRILKSGPGALCALLLTFVFSIQAFAAEKKGDQKDQAPACDIQFVIVKDTNGKPVKNASVILHAVNSEGKQEKGGFQLKTDSEGKTAAPAMPYGKLRVQVLAQGFQTFGEDYDIDQPQKEIVIKMKRPSEQYSIYK